MSKHKRALSLERRKSRYGLYFIIPWLIGIILFFMIPMLQTIVFSFSKVNITPEGFKTTFVGLAHYKNALRVDPIYVDNLKESLFNLTYTVPIIVILSFIFAIILNQEFHGRLIARAVFFLPAIIATGVALSRFNAISGSTDALSTEVGNAYFSGAIDFEEILLDLGLPALLTETIAGYISEISSLIWKCGIQILLLISGLQAIGSHYYEAADVEGATAWEKFWFVTFPMMSQVFLVTVAYTVIDIMTTSTNAVIGQTNELIINQQNYSQSAAMLWIYFPIIGLIIGLVMLIVNKTMIKKWY